MQPADGTIIIPNGFQQPALHLIKYDVKTHFNVFLMLIGSSQRHTNYCTCVILHLHLLCVADNPVLCVDVEFFQLCKIFLFFFYYYYAFSCPTCSFPRYFVLPLLPQITVCCIFHRTFVLQSLPFSSSCVKRKIM